MMRQAIRKLKEALKWEKAGERKNGPPQETWKQTLTREAQTVFVSWLRLKN